jgi:ABC-type thiamine transport system ATPase subunit
VLTEAGGGVADVVEYALELGIWSISNARPIKLSDESFKNLSVGLQNYASQMIKELSQILNMQIIMVSHLPKIINSADKIIDITEYRKIKTETKPKLKRRKS